MEVKSERKTLGIQADVQELIDLGFDEYLKTIKDDKHYLYVGYSAGICVLAKDLHGLDVCDNPTINPYGIDTI